CCDVENAAQAEKAFGARRITAEPLPQPFRKRQRLFERLLVHDKALVGRAAVATERDLKIAAPHMALDGPPNRHFELLEAGRQARADIEPLAVDASHLPLPMQPIMASRG